MGSHPEFSHSKLTSHIHNSRTLASKKKKETLMKDWIEKE